MSEHDPGENAPGTLSNDEVKDELRKLKDNLLNVPSALGGLARAAVGKNEPAPGQPAPAGSAPAPAAPEPAAAAPAPEPAATGANEMVLLSRLGAMERRLEVIERMVGEIHAKLTTREEPPVESESGGDGAPP